MTKGSVDNGVDKEVGRTGHFILKHHVDCKNKGDDPKTKYKHGS